MLRMFMIAAAAVLTLSTAAFAQQGGTAEGARAMLDKAVAAVKADQAVALAMFLKGEGGFLDRELYPFCFRIADGKTLASPKAVAAGRRGFWTALPHPRRSIATEFCNHQRIGSPDRILTRTREPRLGPPPGSPSGGPCVSRGGWALRASAAEVRQNSATSRNLP
jgi:hypothetical protein